MPLDATDNDFVSDVISYSINDACRVTGLGRTKIYALISDGRIVAKRIGRRTLIPAASLRNLINSSEVV